MANKKRNWWQSIKEDLYKAYEGIVQFLKNPFDGLSHLLNKKENPDLIKLHALRNKHYDLIAKEALKSKAHYNALTKSITKDTKEYVNKIIAEESKKLGKAPCEFTILTMGSMAREESGPVTDLEIGIIIKDKTVENYKYFYQLTQNISDRLFLLGEHPDIGGKGLRMDEADNAPPHKRFFARNATLQQEKNLLNEAIQKKEWDKIPYEGSRPFIATIDEFASYSRPGEFTQDRNALNVLKENAYKKEWEKAKKDPKNKNKLKTKKGESEIKNEINYWLGEMYRPFSSKELGIAEQAGKSLGRNMALLYGNESMYNELQTKKQGYLNLKSKNGLTNRQNIALSEMVLDIQNNLQKGKSIYVTGELGKTMDIKRELYRFTEQFATNLGFYHQCKSQNVVQIIEELKQRNILSSQLSHKMTDYIQFATYLRLKEQSLLKRQGFAAYFNAEEFEKDKKDLEEKMSGLEKSIDYLESLKHKDKYLDIKKRELNDLKDKYHHLLDMAPNQIYSENDVRQLQEKYAPLAKEIFTEAQNWTKGQNKLGFNVAPIITPIKSVKNNIFTPALQASKQIDKQQSVVQNAPELNFQNKLIAALSAFRPRA